jgi:hypothetical protein
MDSPENTREPIRIARVVLQGNQVLIELIEVLDGFN